jgi:CMP-N,N'-diacetyllegionaminic acid synthase
MKILAIIPARQGSKGLKNKNILNFNGKPLFWWTYRSAVKSKYISNIFLSTESKKIKKIAKKFNIDVPHLRPKKFATDQASSYSVIKNSLETLKSKDKLSFDTIILLEPTSPLRNHLDIDKSIRIFKKKRLKTLVSVSKTECQHPNFLYKKNKKNFLKPYFKKKNKNARRQILSRVFFPDGNIYISDIKIYLKKKTFYHDKTYALEMTKLKSIEIDDKFDFKVAEYIMKSFKI